MATSLQAIQKLLREVSELGEAKLTPDAQEFISKKISILTKEGKPQEQAVAIAYSMAREKGYDVPDAPKEDDEPKVDEPAPETTETEEDEPEKDGEEQVIEKEGEESPEEPAEKKEAEEDDGEEKEEEPAEEPEEQPVENPLASLGLTESKLRAACKEYNDFCEFVDMYKDGNPKAFKKDMAERNSSLGQVIVRPPRRMFEKLVEAIEKRYEVNNPEAVAGWVWYNWVKPADRARLGR